MLKRNCYKQTLEHSLRMYETSLFGFEKGEHRTICRTRDRPPKSPRLNAFTIEKSQLIEKRQHARKRSITLANFVNVGQNSKSRWSVRFVFFKYYFISSERQLRILISSCCSSFNYAVARTFESPFDNYFIPFPYTHTYTQTCRHRTLQIAKEVKKFWKCFKSYLFST